MKIIYATSELDEWIEVAKQMSDKFSWNPIYWITTPRTSSNVIKEFPSVITQDYIDATRGIYTKVDSFEFKIPLDEPIIEKYIYHEKIALKMMDRMDPTAYSFNNNERIQLYYNLLSYWINMITLLKPDYVLFSESPHALFHYILYAVCIENNIKTLKFTPTHIDGLTFLSSSIDTTPAYLEERYTKLLNNGYDFNYKVVNNYLVSRRGDYEKALPYYMKEIIIKHTIFESMDIYKDKIKRFISHRICTAYKKGSSFSLNNGNITKIDLLQYKLKGLWTKYKLRKSYDDLASEVDFAQPYIYVALHYQPEKTTSPEGGVFSDQWLMIQMLSILAPIGWKIYVKEHISQFSKKFYGEQGRVYDFYTNIVTLKNVQLVKNEIDSFELIDNSKAVATVTGTVGLESIIRGKPVFSFGYAWYKTCKGVIDIKSTTDLQKAFDIIKDGYIIKSEEVDTFLFAVEEVSYSCYLNPGNKIGVSFGKEENIQSLVNCLSNYFNKI
jgi:tetratricopeptide (TPR) repeat protein